MTFSKRMLVILAAVLTLLGAMAAQAIADDYDWPHNGCTNAPDNPGVNFTHACNQHDGCYARHWANRDTCDGWFWNDMIAECRKQHFELIARCGGIAVLYYSAVRIFGDRFYNSNGEHVRIDTPVQIA